MNSGRSAGRKGVGFLLLVVVIGLFVFVLFNRQWMYDMVRVYSYQPASELASIPSESGLNDNGTFLLYVGQPAILDKTTFSTKCGNSERGTAILGCYTKGNIYIYDVAEPRLAGIKEVTATHEMLHVAYERLNDADRNEVDSLLEQEYRKMLQGESFAARMQYYADTEPDQKYNELHSIIATEVDVVSPRLETYYKRFFSDRAKTVNLHKRYASVFTELEQRSEQLVGSINQAISTRNQLIEDYRQRQAQLSSDIESFKRRQQNNTLSISEERALAAQLNVRVTALNDELPVIKQRVTAYDDQVKTMKQELEANQINQQQLNDSMDSSLEPAPDV